MHSDERLTETASSNGDAHHKAVHVTEPDHVDHDNIEPLGRTGSSAGRSGLIRSIVGPSRRTIYSDVRSGLIRPSSRPPGFVSGPSESIGQLGSTGSIVGRSEPSGGPLECSTGPVVGYFGRTGSTDGGPTGLSGGPSGSTGSIFGCSGPIGPGAGFPGRTGFTDGPSGRPGDGAAGVHVSDGVRSGSGSELTSGADGLGRVAASDQWLALRMRGGARTWPKFTSCFNNRA